MSSSLFPPSPFPLLHKTRTRIPSLFQNPNPQTLHHRHCRSTSPEIGAPPQEPLVGIEESVRVLKNAARTRKVPAADVLSALVAVKKNKVEPSSFFETLGGMESPGRTWMLIFTAQGKLEKGRYFPITAVQRFDAALWTGEGHAAMLNF